MCKMLTKCASQIVLQFMYSFCEFKVLLERYPRVPVLLRWLPNRHWTWNMGRYNTSSHADTYSFIYVWLYHFYFSSPNIWLKDLNKINSICTPIESVNDVVRTKRFFRAWRCSGREPASAFLQKRLLYLWSIDDRLFDWSKHTFVLLLLTLYYYEYKFNNKT